MFVLLHLLTLHRHCNVGNCNVGNYEYYLYFFFICIPIENTYVQRAFQLAVSVTMEGVIYLFHCLTLSNLLTFISIFSFVFLTIEYTYM